MGWLGNFLKSLGGAAPKNLVFARDIPCSGFTPEPLTADECYVQIYVDSLRLTQARRFATKFQGVVYTFADLAREGDVGAKYAAVAKPDKLAALDKNSLDRVIIVSRQMMGAAPWRGGVMNLELGLFSIKAGNLLSPIVDYVTKVSSAAGLSFVGAIKPFVPLLTEGMDLLAGQADDTAIEVGVDTSLSPTMSGYYAVINVEKGTIDLSKLAVDPSDGRLLLDGKGLEAGYCVFSLRRTLQKADYGEIPEIKDKWAAFQAAIGRGKVNEAKEAFDMLRLTIIASPDLITTDASALIAKAEAKLKLAFPGGGVARTAKTFKLSALSEVGLYD